MTRGMQKLGKSHAVENEIKQAANVSRLIYASSQHVAPSHGRDIELSQGPYRNAKGIPHGNST